MANIDGKIVDTAEKMCRRLYHLSDDYVVSSYSVKSSAVEMTMTNHLMTLKVKIPTSLVEENLVYQEEIEEYENENNGDNEEEGEVIQEGTETTDGSTTIMTPTVVKNKKKAPIRK